MTAKAEECKKDSFTYNPSKFSATVASGESTNVTVTLGWTGKLELPPSAFPVTTKGWNSSSLPSGWTLTDEIQSPKTSYNWSNQTDTVSVKLILNVPSGATSGEFYTHIIFQVLLINF